MSERSGWGFSLQASRTAPPARCGRQPASFCHLVRNRQECVSLNTGGAFLDGDGHAHLQGLDLWIFCNDAHLVWTFVVSRLFGRPRDQRIDRTKSYKLQCFGKPEFAAEQIAKRKCTFSRRSRFVRSDASKPDTPLLRRKMTAISPRAPGIYHRDRGHIEKTSP